ncbi:MAG TPA: hypothetical protein VFL95_08830 [Gemmatimonadales bacterium]|nr:hypothetical protein [Gemmatimonadales bacterium]
MAPLALIQAAAPAGWVGPTMAISLAVIALAVLVVGIVLVVIGIRLAGQINRVSEVTTGLRDDLSRTLRRGRRLLRRSEEVVGIVGQEANALAHTSRRLRRKVERGTERIQTRLEDLEALYDVVHEEVEDTALDVAAAMRSLRRRDGMIGRVRRLLIPGAR